MARNESKKNKHKEYKNVDSSKAFFELPWNESIQYKKLREYQRHRDELVNLFMGLKDKIKKEDLTLYEPIFTSNIQKSKCFICQGFANIHCINCSNNDNVWLCVDHWRQHIKDKHTKNAFNSEF